jgi:hypothetical protein
VKTLTDAPSGNAGMTGTSHCHRLSRVIGAVSSQLSGSSPGDPKMLITDH